LIEDVMRDQRLQPVWSLLDAHSLSSLMSDGKGLPEAIRIIDTGKVSHETAPLIGAAEAILARARQQENAAQPGLRLTASGFISLRDVAAIFEAMPWEEAEKDIIRHVCKVISERDFIPMWMARLILQKAGFLYRRGDRLIVRKGTREAGTHYADIVASTFWKTDLSDLDGVPLPAWPLDHIGVTLWALSACALQWSHPEELMAATTLSRPTREQVDPDQSMAFGLRVLRPLVWLGLLEMEKPWKFGRSDRRVRKSPLFDETFGFDVTLRDQPAGRVH
jgi:hypothetical protein